MWNSIDNSSAGDYWVEEGGATGAPLGATRFWFWANLNPTDGYNEHDSAPGSASLNTSYAISFYYMGSNQWEIFENGGAIGFAGNSPPFGKQLMAGGERGDQTGRVVGNVSNLYWADTSSQYHSGWTASGYSNPGYILDYGTANWSNGYQNLSWNSGNC